MMKGNALLIVLASLGAGFGSLFASALPVATAESIVFAAAAGCAFGTVATWVVVGIAKLQHAHSHDAANGKDCDQDACDPAVGVVIAPVSVKPKRQAQAPKSFRKRLADFTDQDESAVMAGDDQFQPKMPFWSVVDFISCVPPKSADVIRGMLLAIGRAVRGH